MQAYPTAKTNTRFDYQCTVCNSETWKTPPVLSTADGSLRSNGRFSPHMTSRSGDGLISTTISKYAPERELTSAPICATKAMAPAINAPYRGGRPILPCI